MSTSARFSQSRFGALIGASLRRQWRNVTVAALALLGAILTDALAPWPLKFVLDHILLTRPLSSEFAAFGHVLALGADRALWLCAGAIAAIALAAGTFNFLKFYSSAKVGYQITYELRSHLFAHLQRLSLAYHQRNRSGELLTKVAGDTNLLREVFSDWLLTFAAHSLSVLTMLSIMFWLNWRLALVVAVSLIPLMGVIFVLNLRVRASATEQRRTEGRMVSRLNEVLASISLVHAFGRQRIEEDRFKAEIAGNYESGVRTARMTAAIGIAIAVVSAIGTAIAVLVGAQQVIAARLTPGELLIFLTYVGSLYKPVRDLGRLSAKFSRARVSIRRVAEILEVEPDVQDADDALDLHFPPGEIVFQNVCFAYPGGKPVLNNVSMRIAAGEQVALVGPSGSGKSTMLSLLLRLYDPTSGRILIDGIDIRRFKRESLRREIGIVLQENMLFAVSVRENIAYGAPAASDDDIVRAAQAARAHEFIVQLPQGYETELGERGSTLSGGQRQRLCLARALLKEPAILVMDEPTSSIDAASAKLIHEAVARVHRGKTLLVISHEYSDMQRYDRVLVLKAGQLIETGSHETLMRARGAYLSLVERRHD